MTTDSLSPMYFLSASTGALLRRIGVVDEAYVNGAWKPTQTIRDYMAGEDDNVEEITAEKAAEISPEAVSS